MWLLSEFLSSENNLYWVCKKGEIFRNNWRVYVYRNRKKRKSKSSSVAKEAHYIIKWGNFLKRLLKKGDYWRRLCVSIIVLSLMLNLLFIGKTIVYKIQVLSLNWLMKRIWSIRGNKEERLGYDYVMKYKDQLR